MNEEPDALLGEAPKRTPLVLELAGQPVPPNELYRFLGTYYIYQDQIGWSRTQTLAIVEAGVLAGAFSRQGPLSPLLLVLGALLVHWLFRLVQRDWQVRDHIGNTLDSVNKPYAVVVIPPPPAGGIRGRTLVTRIAHGIIVLNLALAALRTWALVGESTATKLGWWMR